MECQMVQHFVQESAEDFVVFLSFVILVLAIVLNQADSNDLVIRIDVTENDRQILSIGGFDIGCNILNVETFVQKLGTTERDA